MQGQTFINENVMLPAKWIWVVIVSGAGLVTVLIGGIGWLTSMRSDFNSLKASDSEKSAIIRDIQQKQNSAELTQSRTDIRLNNIENIMTEIQKDVKKILTAPQYRNLP